MENAEITKGRTKNYLTSQPLPLVYQAIKLPVVAPMMGKGGLCSDIVVNHRSPLERDSHDALL